MPKSDDEVVPEISWKSWSYLVEQIFVKWGAIFANQNVYALMFLIFEHSVCVFSTCVKTSNPWKSTTILKKKRWVPLGWRYQTPYTWKKWCKSPIHLPTHKKMEAPRFLENLFFSSKKARLLAISEAPKDQETVAQQSHQILVSIFARRETKASWNKRFVESKEFLLLTIPFPNWYMYCTCMVNVW